MNDREIKVGRKKYNKLQTEKEYYLSKKQELEELKKDPRVQEYLETINYLNRHTDKEFEEDTMKLNAFKNLASRTKNSSNILVFLGFKDIHDNATIHPQKIDYAAFMDLETMEPCNIYNINPTYYDEFCKDKNIVYFDDPYKYHNSGYYMKKFFELRTEYLGSLVELDQESAIEKVMKKVR